MRLEPPRTAPPFDPRPSMRSPSPLFFTLVGFLVSRRPRLVHVDIPIERLPPSLHGFAIAADQRRARRTDQIRRRFVERLVGGA